MKRLKKLKSIARSVKNNSKSSKQRYVDCIISIESSVDSDLFFSFLSRSILQHMGTREGVASKIDAETQIRLQEMIRALASQKQPVIEEVLNLVNDIKPEMHKNYREDL